MIGDQLPDVLVGRLLAVGQVHRAGAVKGRTRRHGLVRGGPSGSFRIRPEQVAVEAVTDVLDRRPARRLR